MDEGIGDTFRPQATSLSLLEHGLAESFLEPDLAESRLAGRNQRALAERATR